MGVDAARIMLPPSRPRRQLRAAGTARPLHLGGSPARRAQVAGSKTSTAKNMTRTLTAFHESQLSSLRSASSFEQARLVATLTRGATCLRAVGHATPHALHLGAHHAHAPRLDVDVDGAVEVARPFARSRRRTRHPTRGRTRAPVGRLAPAPRLAAAREAVVGRSSTTKRESSASPCPSGEPVARAHRAPTRPARPPRRSARSSARRA